MSLKGAGPEVRSLTITRGTGAASLPKGAKSSEQVERSPIEFEWMDRHKKRHRAAVKLTGQGLEFESTKEKLPNCFFFAAQAPVPSREAAARFSDLRKVKKDREFVRLFREVFDWVEDLSVEEHGGIPVLHASVAGVPTLLPLPMVSGAINRFAAILLAVAHRPKGIVMVDEAENGIFYTREPALLRALLKFSREYQCQLFLSTHSQEWLRAFVDAADKEVSDIALWRIERAKGISTLERFDGRTLKAGIKHGAEVRRDQSS